MWWYKLDLRVTGATWQHSTFKSRVVISIPVTQEYNVVTTVAMVTSVAEVPCLSWELPHTTDVAGKKKWGGPSYCKGQQSQTSLIHTDLWHWLIYHGFLRSKIDKKPTKLLFDPHKQKQLDKVNKSLTKVTKTDSHRSLFPRLEPVYRTRNLSMRSSP